MAKRRTTDLTTLPVTAALTLTAAQRDQYLVQNEQNERQKRAVRVALDDAREALSAQITELDGDLRACRETLYGHNKALEAALTTLASTRPNRFAGASLIGPFVMEHAQSAALIEENTQVRIVHTLTVLNPKEEGSPWRTGGNPNSYRYGYDLDFTYTEDIPLPVNINSILNDILRCESEIESLTAALTKLKADRDSLWAQEQRMQAYLDRQQLQRDDPETYSMIRSELFKNLNLQETLKKVPNTAR